MTKLFNDHTSNIHVTSGTRAKCAPAFSLYMIIMKIITNGESLLFA